MLRLGFALAATAPFLIAACSGANDTGLFGAPATTDTSPTDPTTTPTASPDPTSPTPIATTAPDGGASPDAGTDASPPEEICTQEVEPDDTLDRATPFSTSFCGSLSSATDVDFGQFAVPQGATNLAITHVETDGKVAYRYYMNGVLLPVDASIPATPGIVYGVAIRLAAGSKTNTPSYRLNVAFTY